MTLDITIGKAELYCEDNHFRIGVSQCPELDYDLCKECFTLWPRESYRSGTSSFWQFFGRNDLLLQIYHKMREFPDTNDYEVIELKSFIEDINKLSESAFSDLADKDRLKWLKFWCNRAIELYGDMAAISFS